MNDLGNKVDKSLSILEAITDTFMTLIVRGILWLFVYIHFPPALATILLIAFVVVTLADAMIGLEPLLIGVDLVLTILAVIAMTSLGDSFLMAAGVGLVLFAWLHRWFGII